MWHTIVIWLWVLSIFASADYTLVNYSLSLQPYDRFLFSVDTKFLTTSLNYTLLVSCIYTSQNTSSPVSSIFSKPIWNQGVIMEFQVWNFQAGTVNFLLTVKGTMQQYGLVQNCITVLRGMSLNDQIIAIFTQPDFGSYMLPFNLFQLKDYGVTVVERNASINLYPNSIQPFVSTYWNELRSTEVLLPWLPFFSQCSLSKRYIVLTDLIMPDNCSITTTYWNSYADCTNKSFDFSCVMEQLCITMSAEPWFNIQNGILFYLFPSPISRESLLAYNVSLAGVRALLETYYSSLVPLIYTRMSSSSTLVNMFTFTFETTVSTQGQLTIISASLVGSYSQSIPQPYSKVRVNVDYLNNLAAFWHFSAPALSYVLFSIVIGLILGVGICFLQNSSLRVDYKMEVEPILFPILKGFWFCLCSAYIYVVIMYEISANSNFSTIVATFQGDLSGQALRDNDKGRNGLMLFFAGIFIANSCVNQAFKVASPEEIKIILEDDRSENARPEEEVEERSKLMIQNMNSHRKYLLICTLLGCTPTVFIYYMTIRSSFTLVFLLNLLILPLFKKILTVPLRYVYLKDLLYINGITMAFETFFSVLTIQSETVLEFAIQACSRLTGLLLVDIGLEVVLDYLCKALHDYPSRNCLTTYLWAWFEPIITTVAKESQYERSLYYSSLFTGKICRTLLTPFFLAMLLLTLENNCLASDLLTDQTRILLIMVGYSWSVGFQVYLLIFCMKTFQKQFGVKMENAISFNQFKFKRRKLKWMNDYFNHNKSILQFYRQFEKFYFSSQLYFLTCALAVGLCTLGLGVKTVISSSYILYNDPALMVVGLTCWLLGYLLSFVGSFVALKLKLYERKEEEMTRSKLTKIDKYLKKSDYSQYLGIEGVKNHFLHFNKQWVVSNLHLLLTKEDFAENNDRLLNTYKEYKSLAKKKQIQAKRKIKASSAPTHPPPPPPQEASQVIKMSKVKFEKYARPIFYSWFYLARQNLYLKGIVAGVPKEKIKHICESCNMNIELEAVEKKEFQYLVNQFRVVNVGKVFAEHVFLEFYRTHQEYITVCVECKEKKVYLEKRIIKSAKGAASKLILRWLVFTRSRMLHQRSLKIQA